MKTLFLTLKTFSATGAIEKACRVTARALYENSISGRGEFFMFARDDESSANTQPYLPANLYRSFNRSHLRFTWQCLRDAKKFDLVVLSHFNLLPAGYFMKMLAPKIKLVLIAHGIEIWKPIPVTKKFMMQKVDWLVPASNFTKSKIESLNGISHSKFCIVYNCLDPFLPAPPNSARRKEFRYSYGFEENDVVIMAFSRISESMNDIGYDKILVALKKLQSACPRLRLLCVGKYREGEKKRLDLLINALGIEFDVIFTGFVPETVIGEYFNMADAYIIPGEKEVFGFPFLEALYYNKIVIAGKIDEDTTQGYENKMGHFIDINDQEEIIVALKHVYDGIDTYRPDRSLLVDKFSFPAYKANWQSLFDKIKLAG